LYLSRQALEQKWMTSPWKVPLTLAVSATNVPQTGSRFNAPEASARWDEGALREGLTGWRKSEIILMADPTT
jgi:hypothetical protein